MYPKSSYEYELNWEKNGKIYSEQLGHCNSEDMMEKLKKISNDKKNKNIKINSKLSVNINKFGYIIEFDGITKENNIYIDTGNTFQTYITKNGLEIEFIFYLYNFKKNNIEIYKGNYIYCQDIIYINKINKKTYKMEEYKNMIITNPKKEKLIDKIGGNYHKLIIFLKKEINNWYNNMEDIWIGD